MDAPGEITHGQTLRLFARGLRYVQPVWRRFAVKALFTFLSLLPLIIGHTTTSPGRSD